MKWESITTDFLLAEFQKRYSDILFNKVNDLFEGIEGKLNKEVFLEIYIMNSDSNYFKSNLLVHVGITQRKRILQGYSCAVDSFDDLYKEIDRCIELGNEWIGKNIKKKLI